jgi:putative flippase GtrA
MWQFFIFAGIGVLNTALDFVIWHGLIKLFKSNLNLFGKVVNNYTYCQAISYSLAVIFSYFMNKVFAFKSEGNFAIFLIINLFSLSLSTFLISTLTKRKSDILVRLPFLSKHFYSVIKLSVVFFTMIISFFGYKFFVFL